MSEAERDDVQLNGKRVLADDEEQVISFIRFYEHVKNWEMTHRDALDRFKLDGVTRYHIIPPMNHGSSVDLCMSHQFVLFRAG